MHVHVTKDGITAKFDVVPEIRLTYNAGFKKSELKIIEAIIEENRTVIITRWYDFFNK